MPAAEQEEHRAVAALASALIARGVARRFRRGQALVYQGQLPDRVLLITSGRVKIVSTTAAGREVLLGLSGPGELMGELAALDDRPRSATVVALEAVEAVALSQEAFRSVVMNEAGAAWCVLQVLARRLRDANCAHVQLAGFTTLERVATRLLELNERFGRRDGTVIRIALPLSQEELASWSASSVESVGRALRTMRSLGWIETRRREIVIRSLEPLHRTCREAAALAPV